MTDGPGSKRSLRTAPVILMALMAALLLVPAAPDEAAAFKFLMFGKQAVDANETRSSLGKARDKILGRSGGFVDLIANNGTNEQAEAIFQGAKRDYGGIFLDAADPSYGVGPALYNKLKSAKDKIKSVVGRAADTVSDARTEALGHTKTAVRTAGTLLVPEASADTLIDRRGALAVPAKDRALYESGTGILGDRPLPTPKRVRAVSAAPKDQTSDWGSASGAAAGQTSSWGNSSGASSSAAGRVRPSGWGDAGSFDEWVIKKQDANPDCYGIVDDNTDCGAQATNEERTGASADDERRSDYEAALADTLSDEPVATDDGDYQGALSALEAKEAERERQARLAEQRRLEQLERERQARLAEQRRLERLERERQARLAEQRRLERLERERQARLAEQRRIEREEQERQARLAEQRRREAEAASTYSSSSSSSSRSRPTYDSGPSTGELIRQSLEALQQGLQNAYGTGGGEWTGSAEPEPLRRNCVRSCPGLR